MTKVPLLAHMQPFSFRTGMLHPRRSWGKSYANPQHQQKLYSNVLTLKPSRRVPVKEGTSLNHLACRIRPLTRTCCAHGRVWQAAVCCPGRPKALQSGAAGPHHLMLTACCACTCQNGSH